MSRTEAERIADALAESGATYRIIDSVLEVVCSSNKTLDGAALRCRAAGALQAESSR